jgi:hypothetical protein
VSAGPRRVQPGYCSANNAVDIKITGQITKCTEEAGSYDHLGLIRLVTDQSANLVARDDYLPSGEEIYGAIAGRNTWYSSSAGTLLACMGPAVRAALAESMVYP